ncbi:MAG: L,D-transpeptidase family protein [Patescibacteria group bacterium]
MNFSFDTKRAWYASKLILFFAVIIFSGKMVFNGFDDFLKEQNMDGPSPLRVVRKQEIAPVYEKISPDTIIYASRHEVLKKRDELMKELKSFIFTDLNNLEVQLYQNGEFMKSFQVLGKGKVGSLFETPNGYYNIRGKESNHFSSIGKVWMPWSMHFFGNYFIHGWPYYPDGTPVTARFSGGCIRMSDKDAEELFNIAHTGMPFLVYAGTTTPSIETTYFKKIEKQENKSEVPLVSADAVLAADFETGQILFEKNSRAIHPIASITKLMSALTAMEIINRFKVLTITESSLAEIGDSAGLLKGETFEAENLLYPLLLTSSNDVAKLFEKESYGLINAMNQKAKALGLVHTSFKDASGISSENISNTEDIFKLLQFLNAHKKPIFTISGLKEYTLASLNKLKEHVWTNVNWTPSDDRFIGGKAGKTAQAGETMAGVFHVRFPEFETRPIAIIVLHSENRTQDVEYIIQYLGKNFLYGATSLAKKESKDATVIREGANIYEAVKFFINRPASP